MGGTALWGLLTQKGPHGLAPEATLVPAEPVDGLVVEVRQSQVAERDVTRWACQEGPAMLGDTFVAAIVGYDFLPKFGARFTAPASPLLSGFHLLLAQAAEGLDNLALHPQQSGFNRRCPAKSPEERGQPTDKLLFDRRLR